MSTGVVVIARRSGYKLNVRVVQIHEYIPQLVNKVLDAMFQPSTNS